MNSVQGIADVAVTLDDVEDLPSEVLASQRLHDRGGGVVAADHQGPSAIDGRGDTPTLRSIGQSPEAQDRPRHTQTPQAPLGVQLCGEEVA